MAEETVYESSILPETSRTRTISVGVTLVVCLTTPVVCAVSVISMVPSDLAVEVLV